jgi:hypothetical protein
MMLNKAGFSRAGGVALCAVAAAMFVTGCAAFNPGLNPNFHPGEGAATTGAAGPAGDGTGGLPGLPGDLILPGSLPPDFPAGDVPVAAGDIAGGFTQANGTSEKTWFFDVMVDGSVDDAVSTAKGAFASDGFAFEDIGSQVHEFEHKDSFYYDPDAHAIGLEFTKPQFSVFVTVTTDVQGGTLVSYVVDRTLSQSASG